MNLEDLKNEIYKLKRFFEEPIFSFLAPTETVSLSQVIEIIDNFVLKQEEQVFDHEMYVKAIKETADKGHLVIDGERYSLVKRPTVPKFVADWISEHRGEFDLYPALRKLENGSTRDYVTYKWYRENVLGFLIAYLTRDYEVEEEIKTYRFTQNAFMEQDFSAATYEEAEKMAQDEWNRMFEKEGLFGEPEFEGWVEE